MDEVYIKEIVLGDVSSGEGVKDDIPSVEVSSGDVLPDISSGDVVGSDISGGDISGGDVSGSDVSGSDIVISPISPFSDISSGDVYNFVCSCKEPTPLFSSDVQELDTTDGLLLLILCVLLFIAFVKGGN